MLQHEQAVQGESREAKEQVEAPRERVPVSNAIQLRSASGVTGERVIAFLEGRAVQHKAGGAAVDIHETAASGLSGSASSLPHMDAIQKSFGGHDVSGIQSYVGGAATKANTQMGSMAYATGNAVAFKDSPDLHTAAHEAAHVVQQRSGVSVPGGVGQVGDAYERHADAVADAVVQGKSAEHLLSAGATGGGSTGVQMRAVQMHSDHDHGESEPHVTPQPASEHNEAGENGEQSAEVGAPVVEGEGRRGGPIEGARAQAILQEAFGEYKTISQGDVQVLSQEEFQAAWQRVYGGTSYDWDTWVAPTHGNLNGFAHEGVNYVNATTANTGTVPHEMLHNNTAADFIPFVGSEFNEGSTDVLKQHALKKAGVKSPNSYPNQIKCVEKFLASGVSKEQLFTAYLKGGAAQIVGKHVDNTCKGNWAAVKNAMQKKDWASARANLAKK